MLTAFTSDGPFNLHEIRLDEFLHDVPDFISRVQRGEGFAVKANTLSTVYLVPSVEVVDDAALVGTAPQGQFPLHEVRHDDFTAGINEYLARVVAKEGFVFEAQNRLVFLVPFVNENDEG